MKVVILAGGLPSTISEENDKIPKPMVRVGERPLIWHIMKLFSLHGLNEFLICTGYKSEVIKDYFTNYFVYKSDITIDLKSNEVEIHNKVTEPWKVTIVDTGLNTSTADRIQRVEKYLKEEDFFLTYGDCISDIDVTSMIKQHGENQENMTIAVAHPTGRSASLPINNDNGCASKEKDSIGSWANACNMIVSSKVLSHISPGERFEVDTLNRILQQENVGVYKHEGFWLPIETMRDKEELEELWDGKKLPWQVNE